MQEVLYYTLYSNSGIDWKKCIVLDTKSTIVITILSLIDSASSTTESILIAFYYVPNYNSVYSSPNGRCWIGLVHRQKSHVLIYWLTYLDICSY